VCEVKHGQFKCSLENKMGIFLGTQDEEEEEEDVIIDVIIEVEQGTAAGAMRCIGL